MNTTDNTGKYILLDKLFNLYLDMKPDAEDEALLKEEKIDIDQIVEKNMMLFRQFKTRTKAEMNEAKQNRVLAFFSKFKEGLAAKDPKFMRMEEEIIANPKYEIAMFKNLNEVSKQDKKDIIMDVKLLDLLSQMEEEYNKEE